jgi:hypothetical protein
VTCRPKEKGKAMQMFGYGVRSSGDIPESFPRRAITKAGLWMVGVFASALLVLTAVFWNFGPLAWTLWLLTVAAQAVACLLVAGLMRMASNKNV